MPKQRGSVEPERPGAGSPERSGSVGHPGDAGEHAGEDAAFGHAEDAEDAGEHAGGEGSGGADARREARAGSEERVDDELNSAYREAVEEGHTRLERSWPGLIATGLVGGIDVSLGVLALFVVEEATGMRVLGALGFTIGFIALTLGRSELFTENFLVPVAAVVAGRSRPHALVRLWAGTGLANLAGGWIFAWLLMGALPRLADTAVESSLFYVELGIGWESFALGLVAGAAITVMTWMERSSETEFGRVVAAAAIAFLLAATPLNHVIVVSLEMFSALHAGAPFGYGQWAATAAWAALANMVGGLVLVTLIRLVQVGARGIRQERDGRRAR